MHWLCDIYISEQACGMIKYTRAGSPDRYGRSIRNRKIVGSNPTQSTESSVQIPKPSKSNKRTKDNSSTTHGKVEIQISQTSSKSPAEKITNRM